MGISVKKSEGQIELEIRSRNLALLQFELLLFFRVLFRVYMPELKPTKPQIQQVFVYALARSGL